MERQIVKIDLTANELLSFASLEQIVNHLDNQGLVILPTETGYLLAANALDEEAVKNVFLAKCRPNTNPIHVVVSDLKMAERFVNMNDEAKKVFQHFLPGPITVVCPKKELVSDYLVANTGYLGIRVPDCPIVLQVVNALDKPITATSLNISGSGPKASLEETIAEMNWGDQTVYYVKQDHIIKYHSPSTLVKFAEGSWSVLREGPILKEEVEALLAQS